VADDVTLTTGNVDAGRDLSKALDETLTQEWTKS